MAILKYIRPEQAEGETKEAYDRLHNAIGVVPKPFQMMATSPALMKTVQQSMAFFLRHPTFSTELLAHIRMLVAAGRDFAYCRDFNTDLLTRAFGMTPQEAAAVQQDPSKADLPEKDKALLLFVLKVVNHPETATAEDMRALRDLGWTDAEIIEAASYGTNMVAGGMLFTAFRMDED